MHSAYLDRMTDKDTAIILVESLQKEFHVVSTSLPNGSVAGTWLTVDIQDDAIISIQLDEQKTNEMQSDIQNHMKRLQSKKKSRFKRR